MTATARETPSAASSAGKRTAGLTLDGLLDLDPDSLATLYREGRVPHVADVRGDLRGRMLAVVKLPPSVRRRVRAFARSSVFPWRGKSFTPRDEHVGDGINRVLSDRFRLYRFETFIARSRAGDFDALQLDYDNADNPFFIRPIKDEIREIAPRLYLGQAYLERHGKAHLVLYFGLEG